jgi:hypothetical protein
MESRGQRETERCCERKNRAISALGADFRLLGAPR